jgi:TPR repeat protein
MSLDPTTQLALLAVVLPPLVLALVWSSTSRSAFLGFLELGLRRVRAALHPRPALLWIAWARRAHHGFMARAFVAQALATGDPEGWLEQGLLLAEGGLGSAGRSGAVDWFRRAAEAGQPDAMYWYAQSRLWGDAGPPDRAAAIVWLRRGAEAGSGACMARLAEELRGEGSPEAAEEAHRWESRRNAQGLDRAPRHSAALAGRGSTSAVRGRGGRDTLDERFLDQMVDLSKQRWFQGLFWTALVLALLLGFLTFIAVPAWIIYTFATSVAAPGMSRQAPLWLPAGMMAGIGGMAFWLWWEVRTPRRDASVTRLMTRAEGGEPRAAHDLAWAYRRGDLGLPKDALAARVWFGRAAEAGHVPAMLDLAVMLETGEGGFPEKAAALAWLHRAAEAGSAEATRRLEGGRAPRK